MAGGFSIAPEADAQASGGIESDGRVFYDDVTGAGSDTAFMVSPQPTGAELSWLLLGPQAPERLVLKVDLPVGAVLRRTRTDNPIPNDPPSTLEIARGEQALGYIEAPLVYDADGVSVPSDMHIEGSDRIVVSVDHQERDLSYPLYADPEVTVASSRTAGWSGWRNAQYPSPASQSVNYYGWALNDPAYNASGVYMSMPSNTWFSPSGTAASWTYQAPANTYIYRAIFGGMDHTPLRDGFAFSLWYQGLANSPYSWEPNVSYANQSGGFGGNPFGPAAHAAQGQTHDFCFNTRCERGQGSEQNIAHLGLAASNPYNPQAAFYTYGYRAKLTMNWANVLLGDRRAPSIDQPGPVDREWTNDGDNLVHSPGTVSASDLGLGVNAITLSGAAAGNGTLRPPACSGDPQRSPCPARFATSGFSYRLNEGINTLSLTPTDIVDNQGAPHRWTEKIDRTKPAITLSGSLAKAFKDPRFRGLYDETYDLSVTGADGDAQSPQAGVVEARVQLRKPDGEVVFDRAVTEACQAGQNCELTLPSFTLDASQFDDGAYVVFVSVKDAAGNETTRQQDVVIDQDGDVVRASTWSDDPGDQDSELISDTWAKTGGSQARIEELDSEQTTRVVPCPEGAAGCQEVRDRSTEDGDTSLSIVRGSSPGDERIVSRFPILAPAVPATTEPITGPMADILKPWQLPPPGHGETYSRTASEEQIIVDGEQKTVQRIRWADTATNLPIRDEIHDGGSVDATYFVYDLARASSSGLPADFFAVGGDPAPAGTVEEQLGGDPDPEPGPPDPTMQEQIEVAQEVRAALGLPGELDFVRDILQDLTLSTREISLDLIGTPLLADELAEVKSRFTMQGEAADQLPGIATQLPDEYAGAYIDQQTGKLFVGFTSDVEANLARVRSLFSDPARVQSFTVQRTLASLEATDQAIAADQAQGELEPLGVVSFGVDPEQNVVEIEVENLTPEIEAQLRARYGEAARVVQGDRATPAGLRDPSGVETFGFAIGGVKIVSTEESCITNRCTSGLAFYEREGNRKKWYTSTAGHCSSPGKRPNWYHTEEISQESGGPRKRFNGRTAFSLYDRPDPKDAQLLKTQRFQASPRIYGLAT